MTATNAPIAALLGFEPRAKLTFTAAGKRFEYYGPTPEGVEGLYRIDPGHGVGNPCFALHMTPVSHHAMALGQYLACRAGTKRAEAEAIVAAGATLDDR
jgi:hypothetical protein